MSEWYENIPRKANETDCSLLCFNDRKQWCTGYEFSTALNGTCKMFDECSFKPSATERHLGLADLNRLYRNGGPSNDVAKAGLFVHQHDSAEEWDKPLFDVSSQKPLSHWAGSFISRATTGLYSADCGIILAPQVVKVLCSYYADFTSWNAGCETRDIKKLGLGVGGPTSTKHEMKHKPTRPRNEPYDGPDNLEQMLQMSVELQKKSSGAMPRSEWGTRLQRSTDRSTWQGASKELVADKEGHFWDGSYNEVLINRSFFTDHVPGGIAGIFFLSGQPWEADAGRTCAEKTLGALRARYGDDAVAHVELYAHTPGHGFTGYNTYKSANGKKTIRNSLLPEGMGSCAHGACTKAHAQKVTSQATRGSHKDRLLTELHRVAAQIPAEEEGQLIDFDAAPEDEFPTGGQHVPHRKVPEGPLEHGPYEGPLEHGLTPKGPLEDARVPEGPYEQRARWSKENPLQVPAAMPAATPDADARGCVAVAGSAVDDTWCQQSCNHVPEVCPAAMCTCALGAISSPASGANVASQDSDSKVAMKVLAALKRAQVAAITAIPHADAANPHAAKPDLRKTGCKDDQLKCTSWAADKQCESNPDYMMKSCAFSCTRCSEGPQFAGKLRSLSQRKKLLHMRNRDVVNV
jgi:hypothetical protein